MKYIYCPLCSEWGGWGGYLDPIIKDIKRHVRKMHPGSDTRTNGGIVDEVFGALLAESKRDSA
ncbi:MAG: hypothetical protein KGI71_04205 [Patescibacteria group bacterium]|nr:hypothetical protein [Patescibacteria group bacterium]